VRVLHHRISFRVSEGKVLIEADVEKDGELHSICAEHALDDSENRITVDGQDVEQDDVDLNFDNHFGWSALEYRLEYRQDDQPHELVLTARVDWF